MKKLVICDVDGTLVEDGGNASMINHQYYNVIEDLANEDIGFVVCSGRQKVSIERLFEPVADKIYVVADGGGSIFHKGQCIYSKEIDRETALGIIEDGAKISQCDILVCALERSYARSKDSEMYRWMRESYEFDIEAVGDLKKNVNEPIVKVSLYHRYMVEELTKPWFVPKWEDKVKLNLAGIQWLDCVPKDSGKGPAVEFLQKRLGVGRENTYVFGDNQNDIEMLKLADHSYAVENARQEVKEAAEFVCPSYKEDGVLNILKKIKGN